MQSRRTAIITLAGATAAMAQHAGHDHMDTAAGPQPHDPVFFNKADYATVSRLADLIIPRTNTPGAVDANVPYRIDHQVSAHTELQSIFQQGLAALPADFIRKSEAQQTAILTAMSQAPDTPGGRLFQTMKDLTIDWYYRSEEGLVTELGFHGNTFRPQFPRLHPPRALAHHSRSAGAKVNADQRIRFRP